MMHRGMNTILVVAAHPDDEVLGCGGTIARLSRQGAVVHIVIVANGLTSRMGFDQKQQAAALAVHHERARLAGGLLGAASVEVLGLPDQKLDIVPLLEITQAIERQIDRRRPDTVFTQHGGDLNLDHSVIYRAALTATRPTPGHCVRRVYSYEVASSTEWSFQKFEPQFRASVFVDIAATLETKIKAMQVYESETRVFPHPRSPEALRAIALRWGSVVGVEAAEAFNLVREIK